MDSLNKVQIPSWSVFNLYICILIYIDSLWKGINLFLRKATHK